MRTRRDFLAGCPACLPAWPLPLRAQDRGRQRRVAYLGTSSASQHLLDAFLLGLNELGWSVGRNLILDVRLTQGDPARVGALTQELMGLRPDLFVATTDTYVRAAVNLGTAVPIVFVLGFDPIGLGVVKALSRPGGHATGFAVLNWELNPKRLSLLKEALPRLDRVGVLYRDDDPRVRPALEQAEQAGRALQILLIRAPIQRAEDFEAVFQRLAQAGARGLIGVADNLFFQSRQRLADLALQHRLAATIGAVEFADAGMLMAYAVDFKPVFSRAAVLVDRILNGAEPSDIPVEIANAYEFVVNLRTARALGIALPRSLRLQATRVIE